MRGDFEIIIGAGALFFFLGPIVWILMVGGGVPLLELQFGFGIFGLTFGCLLAPFVRDQPTPIGSASIPTGHGVSDVAYVWRVRGTDYYKVGITSSYRDQARMNEVAAQLGCKPQIIEACKVGNARAVEKRLKALGGRVDAGGINGHTEFRHFTASEAAKAAQIVRGCA